MPVPEAIDKEVMIYRFYYWLPECIQAGNEVFKLSLICYIIVVLDIQCTESE